MGDFGNVGYLYPLRSGIAVAIVVLEMYPSRENKKRLPRYMCSIRQSECLDSQEDMKSTSTQVGSAANMAASCEKAVQVCLRFFEAFNATRTD